MRLPYRGAFAMRLRRSVITRVQSVNWLMNAGNTSQNTSIETVDPARTLVFPGGYYYNNTGPLGNLSPREVCIRLQLSANGAALEAVRDNTPGDTNHHHGYATVVEFAPGFLFVQRGTDTIANGAASKAVTLAKAIDLNRLLTVNNLGHSSANATAFTTTAPTQAIFVNMTMTNATTLTAARVGTSGALTFSYEVGQLLT